MLSQCQQGSQCLEGASEVFLDVVPSEAEGTTSWNTSEFVPCHIDMLQKTICNTGTKIVLTFFGSQKKHTIKEMMVTDAKKCHQYG